MRSGSQVLAHSTSAARAVAERRQQLAFDDRLDLVGAEHRKHDGIAALREIGDRGRRPAAELGKLRVLGGIKVESGDLEAGTEQATRQRLTQQADADQTDRSTFDHCSAPQVAIHAKLGGYPGGSAARPRPQIYARLRR